MVAVYTGVGDGSGVSDGVVAAVGIVVVEVGSTTAVDKVGWHAASAKVIRIKAFDGFIKMNYSG